MFQFLAFIHDCLSCAISAEMIVSERDTDITMYILPIHNIHFIDLSWVDKVSMSFHHILHLPSCSMILFNVLPINFLHYNLSIILEKVVLTTLLRVYSLNLYIFFKFKKNLLSITLVPWHL